MTRVVCVLPPWLAPLAQSLATTGLDAVHLWPAEAGQEFDHLLTMGGIDLQKALHATGVPEDVLAQWHGLPANASRAAALFEGILAQRPDALFVSYTADVCGRTALAAAKRVGVPVIHLSHSCASLTPAEAPFLRDGPGDVVLVGGERDRGWWRECAPQADVRVTGLPQWDWTYGRLPRPVPEIPTLAYICESGANAYQSPLVWQHRDVPQRTWAAFLLAMQRLTTRVKVLLKARAYEDERLTARWLAEAKAAGLDVIMTDAHLSQVLPQVDLVLGQQSNALVESLLCGVPVVANVTRPGVTLLEGEVPTVSGLAPDLADQLYGVLLDALVGGPMSPMRCRDVAARYQRNDGRCLERVCQVVREVADGVAPPSVARELVLA